MRISTRQLRLSCVKCGGAALLAASVIGMLSCGTSTAPRLPAQPAATVATVVARAVPAGLGSTQPLDARSSALLRPAARTSAGLRPALPMPLPAGSGVPRAVSAVNVPIAGKNSFDASPQAVVVGNATALDSSLEPISWAIYEVPGVAAPNTIAAIVVQAAVFTPAGSDPGFYVGLANYDLGYWELAGHAPTTTWTGTVPLTAPYRSPAGSVFIYVLVHGGQALSINQLTISLDTAGWYETKVDTSGNTGWFPAAAFLSNGNPVVVYTSLADGLPRMAVGDRTGGLADAANWARTVIDPMIDAQVAGTTAAYLDVVISPLGLPRVAYSYLGVTSKGAALNSIPCFSVLTEDSGTSGPELNWLNFRFGDEVTGDGYLDGAGYSSVDYDPVAGHYASATYLRNANSTPAEPERDMLIRVLYFIDADPRAGMTSDTLRHFALLGPAWLYPHLRFHPTTGRMFVLGEGATVYQQVGNLSEWSKVLQLADTTAWGSLAFNPAVERFGMSYCTVLPGGANPPTRLEATYIGEITNPSSLPQEVDGVDHTAAGEAVALCSELAYTPAGKPCLAYTAFDGTATRIRFATLDGATWQVEELPFPASVPTDPNDQVLLDLAVDNLGVPLIAYTYLNGADAELHVAVKSF